MLNYYVAIFFDIISFAVDLLIYTASILCAFLIKLLICFISFIALSDYCSFDFLLIMIAMRSDALYLFMCVPSRKEYSHYVLPNERPASYFHYFFFCFWLQFVLCSSLAILKCIVCSFYLFIYSWTQKE